MEKEKEKEIKIIPPAGYEIDRENSSFELIKFKRIERWRDSNPVVDGWYLGGISPIYYGYDKWRNGNFNVFATERQAKSAFAMAKISQIMANDKRFGGVVTDEEWKDDSIIKKTIARKDEKIFNEDRLCTYTFLAFHTVEQRALFLKENEDLVKDYLMI